MSDTRPRGRPAVPKEAKTAWQHARRGINLNGLARKLGISAPGVCKWTHVPADRLEAVVRYTGLSHRALRPDLYPETPDPWAF